MKKENNQSEISKSDMKKQFLLDMIEVFKNEKDITKRLAMQKSIHEYILANNSLVHEILNWMANSQKAKIINRYFNLECNDLNNEISKYKIDLNKLAIVSVKSNLWENLSPYTESEMKRLYKGYSADVSREFNLEDIWEFAVLGKDRKSFVLVRDFLDKKIQPTSNCVIWGGLTVDELILRDHQFHKDEYRIDFFPKQMLAVPGTSINVFTHKALSRGILLEDLYNKNYECIAYQMKTLMKEREDKYNKEFIEKQEQEKYNSRQTLEF